MSISAPRYVSGPVVHMGRTTRALAIFQRELLRRATWGPLLAVALTWLVVVISATFNVAFASFTGSSAMSCVRIPVRVGRLDPAHPHRGRHGRGGQPRG